MTCKIRVKAGLVEVDFEGTEDFVKNELGNLLLTVSQLQESLSFGAAQATNVVPTSQLSTSANIESRGDSGKVEGTTGTIAAKLGVKTGPELVLAAAARLTFVVGNERFKRDDLLQEMKTATSYYKQSYSGGNLTQALERLVKSGQFIEQSAGVYAIQANERRRLEMTLVG